MGGVELIGISGASRLVHGYGWRYLCGRDDISGYSPDVSVGSLQLSDGHTI